MFPLETELQTVVSDMRPSGQPRLGRLRKLVRDVREIRHSGSYTRGDFQRLFHAEMRRVRFVTQGVDDQNPYARDEIDNRIGDTAAIAQVGDKFFASARKEISVYDGITMRHG